MEPAIKGPLSWPDVHTCLRLTPTSARLITSPATRPCYVPVSYHSIILHHTVTCASITVCVTVSETSSYHCYRKQTTNSTKTDAHRTHFLLRLDDAFVTETPSDADDACAERAVAAAYSRPRASSLVSSTLLLTAS